MGFECACQLQQSRKSDVDPALFDLCDLTVIDIARVRHLPETQVFGLAQFLQIFSEFFQYFFVGWLKHYIFFDERPKMKDFFKIYAA